MKKILLSIMVLAVTGLLKVSAQNPTFSPGVFSAEDQVTMTIDVTGTPMAGAAEAYIWIWSNPDIGGGRDGVVNGSWTNSGNDAKMTNVGGNKWTFTFTGTTLFGQSPAELKSFGFLVKKKDGSAQTSDYKPFAFDPLVFVASKLRIFPSKVDRDDAVTMNFDRSLATEVGEQRMNPVSITILMLDDAGAQVGPLLTIPATKTGETIWSGSFIPSMSFTPVAGRKLQKFRYHFNGTIIDANGNAYTISGSQAEVEFVTMH